jgi:hypothetical protein
VRDVNRLTATRLFLFGARVVRFVIALHVFVATSLGWGFLAAAGFLAAWLIGYGPVQSVAPWVTGKRSGRVPVGRSAFLWPWRWPVSRQ